MSLFAQQFGSSRPEKFGLMSSTVVSQLHNEEVVRDIVSYCNSPPQLVVDKGVLDKDPDMETDHVNEQTASVTEPAVGSAVCGVVVTESCLLLCVCVCQLLTAQPQQ